MGHVDDTRAGPIVRVRVRARAGRDEVIVEDAVVRVFVRAAPERGKANEAVLRALAKRLGLPMSALELVKGETSRDKRILVRGVDAAAVRARLSG
jgi:hypothetical protein